MKSCKRFLRGLNPQHLHELQKAILYFTEGIEDYTSKKTYYLPLKRLAEALGTTVYTVRKIAEQKALLKLFSRKGERFYKQFPVQFIEFAISDETL